MTAFSNALNLPFTLSGDIVRSFIPEIKSLLAASIPVHLIYGDRDFRSNVSPSTSYLFQPGCFGSYICSMTPRAAKKKLTDSVHHSGSAAKTSPSPSAAPPSPPPATPPSPSPAPPQATPANAPTSHSPSSTAPATRPPTTSPRPPTPSTSAPSTARTSPPATPPSAMATPPRDCRTSGTSRLRRLARRPRRSATPSASR
jgi:hypothetical protein